MVKKVLSKIFSREKFLKLIKEFAEGKVTVSNDFPVSVKFCTQFFFEKVIVPEKKDFLSVSTLKNFSKIFEKMIFQK